jgi:lipoprotein-anchoring transpeptidase ErfK/SrfK
MLRPRPLHLKTPRKRRPDKSTKSSRRPRCPRPDSSTLPYWIAGGLTVLLILLVAGYVEWPRISAYMAGRGTPPSVVPQPAEGQFEQQQYARLMQDLQKKIVADKKKASAKTKELAKLKAESNSPAVVPSPGEPPLALPGTPGKYPARALPLDPNVLTTERIAAYQVALERMHFSCGFIDGDQGMRTQRMLRAFQASRGLPASGFLDAATRGAIGEPGEPFLNYIVTPTDMASIMPKPPTWRAKAQATRLGYNDIWELLAEKFHCTRAYLKGLNRDVKQPVAGSEIIGPKVLPAAPYPHAASLRVNLAETSIEALDGAGKVIAFFPCSIAADKNKRPKGTLTVKSVVPNPDYTFDPALFKDAAASEGLTHKMTIPPGPRNPVGTAWIGLSLPGYGIHGTPEPENISRTQSHGCFRLANWNAEKVLKMVRVGTPVDVEP